jgi:hypothetical protein
MVERLAARQLGEDDFAVWVEAQIANPDGERRRAPSRGRQSQ